jgi:superfamily II DNA or RNA helicase
MVWQSPSFAQMNIYLASSPVLYVMSLGKIGHTTEPYGRRSTYLTGCPPGLTPSYDIDYYGMWETTATTKDELVDYEDEIHNHFVKYRMMREIPGDSEWFNFKGMNPYDMVKSFIETRPWMKRQVPLSEITPPKRSSRYLRKQSHKNLSYLKSRTSRNATLNLLQEPVISAITIFMADLDKRAGYVIAPCGSGKTIMTCKGIRGVKKCVICCPFKQIQNQWLATLIAEGIFTKSQIHIVGGTGTTDPSTIRTIFEGDVFCIISTNSSSHLLVDIINADVECLILDEVHHMVGIVAKEDSGEGRTRRLMLRASELGMKRLSLTYTPRFIKDVHGSDIEYLTMDDDAIFGSKIAELKIRDLIRKGVLPDYRLWTLRDEARKGTGIIGKAECMVEAWSATEMIRGEEKYILHHLIIFVSTTQEAKDLERFFRAKTTDTLVLRVGEKCEDTDIAIAQFTSATRAILINCFVLNEGVDIPCANAVAIMYPKQSRGQITQMVLRAGRWYEGKSVFHILIPTLGDEDLSGFEEVLSALASCDEQIRDEIILRSSVAAEPSPSPVPSNDVSSDTNPECIMIDEFEANEEEIKRCFVNIRKNLFPARESKRIQELCIEKGWDTSIEYSRERIAIPELPEDPKPKSMSWFDYLHPNQQFRRSPSDFVKTILDPHHLSNANLYTKWRDGQPSNVIATLPSVQHITDGYFGKDDTNFTTIREKYGKKAVVARR